jgi:hypothetical protein
MYENLSENTLALIKAFQLALRKDTETSGIAMSTGLNFYYLEPKAKALYPVYYPILASTPRVNPMFNGMRVGGDAVNWKAIVGIDTGGYPAVREGTRNETMNIKTRNYSSTYKFLAKDANVTFQAQAAGLGLDDNIAITQLSNLNAMLNDEERMTIYGNSGPASVGGNGFALGTCGTPVTAQVTTTDYTFTNGTYYVFCVALTAWGVHLATSTGVKLPRMRVSADGGEDLINGGTSKVSLVSNSVAIDGSHKACTATVTAIVGACGYAWYLGTTSTGASNYFYGVTSAPTITFTHDPVTTNQKVTTKDTTSGKGVQDDDYSYNLIDFDGIMTWHFGTSGASQEAYLADNGGAGFHALGNGMIKEFEDAADYLWNEFKISIDAIWVGGNLINAATQAILGTDTSGSARYVFQAADGSNLIGGSKIVQYRWKYSVSGTPKVVDVKTHPWLPDGVVLFDLYTNPYPAAGGQIPAVRRIVSLEDHFSIKWPYRTLQHELGIYCFETMEHYIPFGGGVITGVDNSVE